MLRLSEESQLSAARALATTAANGCTILSERERERESSATVADCGTTNSLPHYIESLAGSFLVIDIDVHANPIPLPYVAETTG
jgi:hypothetical protein